MFKKRDTRPYGDLIPGMDCKDFRPRFFHKSICRNSDNCDYREQGFVQVGRFGEYCTGIKEKRHWDYVLGKDAKRKEERECV